MSNVDATLVERGKRYGSFIGHSNVTQELKAVIARHLYKRDKVLMDDQQECLDMICHKIGRIINGDADYIENYRDIAGYATLVMDRLRETDNATDAQVIRRIRKDGVWYDEDSITKVTTST